MCKDVALLSCVALAPAQDRAARRDMQMAGGMGIRSTTLGARHSETLSGPVPWKLNFRK